MLQKEATLHQGSKMLFERVSAGSCQANRLAHGDAPVLAGKFHHVQREFGQCGQHDLFAFHLAMKPTHLLGDHHGIAVGQRARQRADRRRARDAAEQANRRDARRRAEIVDRGAHIVGDSVEQADQGSVSLVAAPLPLVCERRQSVRICKQAISFDPDYAQAWALMALAQSQMRFWHGMDADPQLAADRAFGDEGAIRFKVPPGTTAFTRNAGANQTQPATATRRKSWSWAGVASASVAFR